MSFISPQKLKQLGILGMNARNINYIAKYNQRHRYPLVDNKLKTKKAALQFGMRVPELFGTLEAQHQIKHLQKQLEGRNAFVIKPAQGSGGKGIMVIANRDGETFYKSSGEAVSYQALQRHSSNIISGLYSLGGRNDVAMIEAMIDFNPQLLEYSYEGVPDIRVIVYRGVPVMAMLRCSTHSSDGKANLHQGAVGVGIDITNGQCHNAVQNGLFIHQHPDTGHVFNDLTIPHWQEILEVAAHSYDICKLGYFGADIVLDKNNGPTVLELNARPGLAIQIANQQGLIEQLKRVETVEPDQLDYKSRAALTLTTFSSLAS